MSNKYNAVYNFYHSVSNFTDDEHISNTTKSGLLNDVSSEITKLKNSLIGNRELSNIDKDKVAAMIADLHDVMRHNATADIRSLSKKINVAALKGVMQIEIKEDIQNEIKIQLMEQAAAKLK
ncbi:hypothetical protein ERX35_000980 [Macrococcus equipercicus]|uniref:Uncharacterized protein n=1 Tax=Macrococcus equipercicus TaxID=69967 RepID=A0ABQ6RBB4_9STAP|nr:hypothetical protein [Macrococcus equipercicus]KAA1042486.1 hypothetical protein ERX35_000980 [Macrococcus equipercicus]